MTGLRFTHGDLVTVEGRAGVIVGVWTRTARDGSGVRMCRWSVEFDDAPGSWSTYDDDSVRATQRVAVPRFDGRLTEELRAETAAVQQAVADRAETDRSWAHDPLTRERLARRYEAAARSEHRRVTDDAAYERGRRDAFTTAAVIARDAGIWEV